MPPYIKQADGVVRPLKDGDVFHTTWYHSLSCFFRTEDRGLHICVLNCETYNGSAKECHEMIRAAKLAGGADFCVKLTARRQANGAFVGEADLSSVAACIEHVAKEHHVYGCDLKPGMSIWVPRMLFGQRPIFKCDRRYSLRRTFLDDRHIVVGGPTPESNDACEQGPLPKFVGTLLREEAGSATLAYPIYTVDPHIVL